MSKACNNYYFVCTMNSLVFYCSICKENAYMGTSNKLKTNCLHFCFSPILFNYRTVHCCKGCLLKKDKSVVSDVGHLGQPHCCLADEDFLVFSLADASTARCSGNHVRKWFSRLVDSSPCSHFLDHPTHTIFSPLNTTKLYFFS